MSIVSIPTAVVVLETPSSSIDERLNALRFIQQFVENGQEISSFTDKIKINQLVLDNVMLVLHREDLIVDLRRRQLIRAECFLMLARVLESKSLFGGTKVEHSENSISEHDVSTHEKEYLNSTVHDASKDLYHKVSLKKDPLKFGGKFDIFKRTKSSIDDSISMAERTDDTTDEEVTHSVTLRSSLSAGSSVPTSTLSRKKDSLFSSSLTKPPNKYNLHKEDGRIRTLPRQSVISGGVLQREPVKFQGVSSYDIATTDKRVGYQKSRLWVPHTGSGRYQRNE